MSFNSPPVTHFLQGREELAFFKANSNLRQAKELIDGVGQKMGRPSKDQSDMLQRIRLSFTTIQLDAVMKVVPISMLFTNFPKCIFQ